MQDEQPSPFEKLSPPDNAEIAASDAEGSPATKICSGCRTSVTVTSKFCALCGYDLRPQAAILEQHRRANKEKREWLVLRNLIWFYVIYLATVLPIAWFQEENQAQAIIFIGMFDALIIIAYWLISQTPLMQAFKVNHKVLLYTLIGCGTLAVLLPMNHAYHLLIQHIFSLPPESMSSLTAPFEAVNYGILIQLFAIAVLPGIWEEIAFRGLIQHQLMRLVGPNEAILLTAALFAIIHAAWLSLPYLFVLGCILGYLRHRSQSLLPGMAVHFLHNAGVIILLL